MKHTNVRGYLTLAFSHFFTYLGFWCICWWDFRVPEWPLQADKYCNWVATGLVSNPHWCSTKAHNTIKDYLTAKHIGSESHPTKDTLKKIKSDMLNVFQSNTTEDSSLAFNITNVKYSRARELPSHVSPFTWNSYSKWADKCYVFGQWGTVECMASWNKLVCVFFCLFM